MIRNLISELLAELMSKGLGRGLSSPELVLLFHLTQVQFPSPHRAAHNLLDSSSRESDAIFGPSQHLGTLIHTSKTEAKNFLIIYIKIFLDQSTDSLLLYNEVFHLRQFLDLSKLSCTGPTLGTEL